MIDFVQVGKKITYYRKLNKLTQDDLADKLYVTRQLVSKWENGSGVPTADALLELSRLFHTSIEDLLCVSDAVELDKKDIFYGHDRMFILESIIKGDLKIDLVSELYRFSPVERMMILKAVKEKRIEININDLYPVTTPSERKYLYDKEIIKI